MNTNLTPAEIQAFIAPLYSGRTLRLIPYAYTVTFSALAQGDSSSKIVSIAANADFLALGLNYRAQIGAAQTVSTKTEPFVRLLILDSGSNEQFTASAVDLSTYGSNDAKVQNFPYPRIVSGRSSLTVTATNYAPTAETYTTLDIVISGVLIRAYSEPLV